MTVFSNSTGPMVAGTQSPNQVCGLRKYHTSRGGEEIAPGTLHGGEEIAPGTLHSFNPLQGGALCASYTLGVYRTRDGSATYKFRYVQVDSSFEIDIIEQPDYLRRDNGSVITHRISSVRGGQQICISAGYKPKTIDKAKKISAEWAELTHQYILTGISIDTQVRKISRENKKAATSKAGGFLNWLFN